MGHLINPIGFRLNFEKKWDFTFFVKNLYYPEIINTLINIRDYLYYYFTRKKILQSGLCLSHFVLCKYLKKLYIKVYLYHIDLQKTSYDLINKLFFVYYESYNTVNCKFIKNKSPGQLKIYHNYRDLSNSDLAVFIFTFKLFYEGQRNRYKNIDKFHDTENDNENVFLNPDSVIMKYNKYVIFCYLKQWMHFYDLHLNRIYNKKKRLKRNPYLNILQINKRLQQKYLKINYVNDWFKWKLNKIKYKNKKLKLAKLKGLILYKAKKILKSKPFFKTIIQKSSYLRGLMMKPIKLEIIKLAWKITKKTLKKKYQAFKKIKKLNKLYILEAQERKEILYLKNILSRFKRLCFFENYNILKFITTGLKKYKLKKKKKLLHRIFYDKAFKKTYKRIKKKNANFSNWLSNINNSKLDIYTIFLYLCKKVSFKKVRNSHDLWIKWNVVFRYICWFYKLNLLKKNNINNIVNFLFYMKTAMVYSWYGANGFKEHLGFFRNPNYDLNSNFPFNFKKHIFYCMSHGIYSIYFKKSFIWMSFFLKIIINIISNLKYVDIFNNIKFQYNFLSNLNITSQFLARYIILKIKKGFTIVKALNPLRKELGRVAGYSRKKQMPYLYYNMFKNKSNTLKLYKKIFNYYLSSCNTYYYLLSNKYYNNNNIFMFPNIFIFYKKLQIQNSKSNKNISKLPYLFKLRNIFENIYNGYVLNKYKFKITYENYKKLKLLQNMKYKYLNKNHLLYPLVSNLDKKNIFYPLIKPLRDKQSLSFLNNCFHSVKNLFTRLELGLKKKKINNYQIAFNSFLNTNYINYTIIKTLWLIYKKLNIRNERDKYLPKYRASIMGYKLVLKGRFSRKQRASKATLLIGKVPLNTLNIKLDYVFMTVPLKNSAISLKLYLYRSNNVYIYSKNVKI
jgi:hypothetical protein